MTRRTWAAVALAGFLAHGAGARAGGLFVPGYGSQAQPRAGAFVAKADDPSALYYNPAGLAGQRGTSIHLGFNFIDFSQTFRRAGVYEEPQLDEGEEPPPWSGTAYPEVSDDSKPALGFGGFQGIPLLGVATDLGGASPVVIGLGIMADHGFPERGYAGSYEFEDPDAPPPPQRYDIVDQDVSAAFPSLAVAYRIVPELDVGVRVSWGFAGSKGKQFVWGLRNYEEDVGRDGVFELDVADNFIPAAGAGLLYRPAENLELGASYHSAKNLRMKGEGFAVLGSGVGAAGVQEVVAPVDDAPLCAEGGTATALKTCVNLELPQTAALGARYVFRDASGAERGDVELDVQWEDWSSASDIEVIVDGKGGVTGLRLNPSIVRHGLRDTVSVRLGGAYGFDLGGSRLEARAGAAHDTAAAPASWTRVDLDGMARTTFGAGAALETGKLRFELGGGLVLEGDRTVSECNPSLDQLGCEATGAETPPAERDAPDPVQPLERQADQVESPFNAGTYSQGYVLLSVGVTYTF